MKFTVVALAALFGAAFLIDATATAQVRILNAIPDEASPGDAFVWNGEAVTDARPLRAVLAEALRGRDHPTETIEIRLLARRGQPETIYESRDGPLVAIDDWRGTPRSKLILRGQIDRSGERPRAITIIKGPSLRDTLCRPDPAACLPPPAIAAAPPSRSGDGLDQIWRLHRRPPRLRGLTLISIGEQKNRLHCIRIDDSSHIDILEMGLRDCWLPAVATFGGRNVALRDSVVQGSSFVFAAFPSSDSPLRPESAHSFEMTGNRWEASTASYRPPEPGCDARSDWDCPISIWSDLPWGIAHGYFWEPLNGALFGARDILGNVKIADNVMIDAYNGVRVKASDECLAAMDGCLRRTNIGFEIARNVFMNMRDNPVEPETHAAFWIVKHNIFKNVHAAISTDGVAGHDVFIFGNVLDFDDIPGRNCRDEGWLDSRKFKPSRNGGAWDRALREDIAAGRATFSKADCAGHRRGTFVKMGWEGPETPADRLLDRLHVFNNSLRTRSPLFARDPASPVASYNNAVAFVGCGLDGADLCRQTPDPDPACVARRHWTDDETALHSDCVSIEGRRAGLHDFRRNVFNRALSPMIGAFEKEHVVEAGLFANPAGDGLDPERLRERFRPAAGSVLENGGCRLSYAQGAIACGSEGGPIGAVLPDGRLFDVALPFSYPFRAALDRIGRD